MHADRAFRCMGSEFRVVVEQAPDPEASAIAAEDLLHAMHRALTRFDESSELAALNGDPRRSVRVSPLLCAVVGAAVAAARTTGGLVDPTMTAAIERAGYRTTRAGTAPLALREALDHGAPRAPAAPSPGGAWREIHVDRTARTVTRPPGLRIDLGGIAKGYAADAAARLLRATGATRFFADCGGDVALEAGAEDPYAVAVEDPLTGGVATTLQLTGGGVATSGITRRVWRGEDGVPRHHLLDPATGEPAWTGVLAATAVAPSVAEAEALAKAALLAGPSGAVRVLGRHGGVLVTEDGRTLTIPPSPGLVALAC